jgi:hypothetical protein
MVPSGDKHPQPKPLQPVSAASALIGRIIAEMESDDGWVTLSAVGSQLANLASDFDHRTYGFGKLSELVRGTNAYEFQHPEGGTMKIRVKPRRANLKSV